MKLEKNVNYQNCKKRVNILTLFCCNFEDYGVEFKQQKSADKRVRKK